MAYVTVARARPALAPGCALFRRFHRFAPDRVVRVPAPRTLPGVLVRLGKLRAVVYRSDKGRQGKPLTYVHFMEHEPWLACDSGGRQLYVLGGDYRVTERGLEG